MFHFPHVCVRNVVALVFRAGGYDQRGMVATMVYSTQVRAEFDLCYLESVSERVLLKVTYNFYQNLSYLSPKNKAYNSFAQFSNL